MSTGCCVELCSNRAATVTRLGSGHHITFTVYRLGKFEYSIILCLKQNKKYDQVRISFLLWTSSSLSCFFCYDANFSVYLVLFYVNLSDCVCIHIYTSNHCCSSNYILLISQSYLVNRYNRHDFQILLRSFWRHLLGILLNWSWPKKVKLQTC